MAEQPSEDQAQQSAAQPTTTSTRRANAAQQPPNDAAAVSSDASGQGDLEKAALDHEKAMARTRGAPEDQLQEWENNLLWVHSNRKDDRVVLYEVDPIHPGGQAFIGGDGPDHVYRTDQVEALLQSGELIEVPEPELYVDDPEGSGEKVRNRFYPDQNYTAGGELAANMPGQPTQLGRKLNPDLWTDDQLKELQRRQAYMPQQRPVPPGGIVPPAAPVR